jgi:hypothetical protein
MNWVSSADKLTDRRGGQGFDPCHILEFLHASQWLWGPLGLLLSGHRELFLLWIIRRELEADRFCPSSRGPSVSYEGAVGVEV